MRGTMSEPKHCYRIGPDIVAATSEANAWKVLLDLYGSVEDYEGEEPELVPDDEPLWIVTEDAPTKWLLDRVVHDAVAPFAASGAPDSVRGHHLCLLARDWANDPDNTTGSVSTTEY